MAQSSNIAVTPSQFFGIEPVSTAQLFNVSAVPTPIDVVEDTPEDNKVEEYEAKIQELESELAGKASQLTQTKSTLDVYKSNLIDMEAKISQLETTLHDKVEELGQSVSMLEAYKAKASELENCASNMSGEISANEEKKSNMEIEKSQLQEQIDSLNMSLEEKNEFIEELKSTIEQKESENNQLNTDLELLSNQVEVLETKIPTIKISEDSKDEEAISQDKPKQDSKALTDAGGKDLSQNEASQLFSGNVMTPNQPVDGASQFFTSTAVKPDNILDAQGTSFDQGFIVESSLGDDKPHVLQSASDFLANSAPGPLPIQDSAVQDQNMSMPVKQPLATSAAGDFFTDVDGAGANNTKVFDPFSNYQQEQNVQQEIHKEQPTASHEETAANYFSSSQQTAAALFTPANDAAAFFTPENSVAAFFTPESSAVEPSADLFANAGETNTAAVADASTFFTSQMNEPEGVQNVASNYFAVEPSIDASTVSNANQEVTEVSEEAVQSSADESAAIQPITVDAASVQIELANYQVYILLHIFV